MLSTGLMLVSGVILVFALIALSAFGQRSIRLQKYAASPVMTILSLGVLSGGVTVQYAYLFHGISQHGVFYLFFGLSLVFAAAPLLLKPVYHCVRKYNFENIADILAFRFRLGLVGPAITLLITLAVLPMISLMLQALVATLQTLQATNLGISDWVYTGLPMLAMLAFVIVLHSHRVQKRKRNNGVILITSFDTALRLICLWVIALYLWHAGTTPSSQVVTAANTVSSLLPSVDDIFAANRNPSNLILFAFTLSLCLPQVFKFAFMENPTRPAIDAASWAVPLLMLLVSLPLLWILNDLDPADPRHNAYNFLAVLVGLQDHYLLSLLLALSALSTFFCLTLVLIGACTTMTVNYWLLPNLNDRGQIKDLFGWLRRSRRNLALIFILVAWLIANLNNASNTLFLAAIIAPGMLLQLFPGLICCVYFPRVSSLGFGCGLVTGLWVFIGLHIFTRLDLGNCQDCHNAVTALHYAASQYSVTISLALNTFVLALCSLLKPAQQRDYIAANMMINRNHYNQPEDKEQSPYTVQDFITALVPLVGVEEAERYVNQALQELQIKASERRPYVLIQLHNVVEKNLSKTLGNAVAQNAIKQLMPYSLSRIQHVSVVDQRLNAFQSGFSGIAGELDKLRRFHRNTLAKLPVGVCFINSRKEILLWNSTLERISDYSATKAEGKYLRQLPAPWSQILSQFIKSTDNTKKLSVLVADQTRWIRLYKDHDETANTQQDNIVVVEDITDIKRLEDELIHRERLASIGSLAAGVAHEIGNPVTGIACLAQNIELDTDNPEILDTANEIIQQTQRISAIMRTLISFSHAGGAKIDIKREPFYIADCIQDAIKLISLDRDATQVNYVFDNSCRDSTKTVGDPQRIQQVFVNLLGNARDASQAGDTITTAAQTIGDNIYVTVTDAGSGVPKDIQEKIFDPFFTTKKVGQGTGLGLALVLGIIEEHDGTIKLTSPLPSGQGTQFSVSLPKR